jgi:membrane protease YdiL (CAAX protease family)
MTRFPHLPAFDAFVAPARLKPQAWRLILGMVLAPAIYTALISGVGILVYLRYGGVIAYGMLAALSNGLTPGGVLMLLFSFTGLAAGAIAVARALHGRRAGTLFGACFAVLRRDFLRVALAVLAVNLIAALVSVAVSGGVTRNPQSWTLWRYYPFALVALLVQVSAEELFFRGYLVQQLAARYAARVIWTGIPAAAFALGHYTRQDYAGLAWLVVVWAGLFGILATDLTVRTGNLGAGIGFHFATNAVALFVLGVEGNLDGLALWSVPVDPSAPAQALPMVAADFLTILVGWLAARLALRV